MRRRAVPAVVAVLALVVSQIAAMVHEAGTRHVTCRRHGEQVEAARLSGSPQRGDHAHWVAVEASGSDHDHCTISSVLHHSSTPGKPWASPAALAVGVPLASPPHAALATLELYRIAPKTSPPENLRPIA